MQTADSWNREAEIGKFRMFSDNFQKQSERQMVFGQRYLVEAVLCRKNRREIEGLAFEA